MFNKEEINSLIKQGLVGAFLGIAILVSVGVVYKATHKKEVVTEPVCNVVQAGEHLNRGDCLADGFVPEDLVPLSRRASWLTTTPYLTLKAKIMVEQLIESAESDGMCLVVTSGYRSFEEQGVLYEQTAEEKRIYVAPAGGSEHQTGLAVDFTACPMKNGVRDDSVEREELTKEFENLPEYEWLVKNAGRYGFEQSFRADNIQNTEYAVESWHWMFGK